MQTTDAVLKLSSFPVCKRRPWACHLLANFSSKSQRRMQRRTRQVGRQAVAIQALDADTTDQMRRTGENVQEAFASGNPDTLRQNGDEMMEVNACSLWLLYVSSSLPDCLCLTVQRSCAYSTCCSITTSHLHLLQQCSSNMCSAGLFKTNGSSKAEGFRTARHTAQAGVAAATRRYRCPDYSSRNAVLCCGTRTWQRQGSY